MKKVLSILLIIALTGGVFTACGTEPQAASTPVKKIVIHSVGMFGGTDPSASAYRKIIGDFMTANPNIIVIDESASVDETWKAKVLTDFSNGNDPDVAFYFSGQDAKLLIENKKVVSIEEIRKLYPDYASNITDLSMGYMKEYDGYHYAVPVRGYYEGLFCNKGLFDKYNLNLPTNWNNLITAIITFKGQGIVPIAASFSDMPHYWIEHLILAEGGIEDHKINPKAAYPESWAKGLGYIKTLYDLGAFPADVNSTKNDIVTNMFYDKKAAMQIDGSWFTGGIKDPATTVVLPFPATPDGRKGQSDVIAGFSSGFYISTKAWNDPDKQAAATAFVQWVTSNESISEYCKVGGAPPAADIPVPENLSTVQVQGLEMVESAQGVDVAIDSRAAKEAWTYLVSMIGNIADGSANPKDVLTEFANKNK